jgi:hypothetical protein
MIGSVYNIVLMVISRQLHQTLLSNQGNRTVTCHTTPLLLETLFMDTINQSTPELKRLK